MASGRSRGAEESGDPIDRLLRFRHQARHLQKAVDHAGVAGVGRGRAGGGELLRVSLGLVAQGVLLGGDDQGRRQATEIGRPDRREKRVAAVVKIQIPAGQATPAPPVGTALGPHGVAIMDFCKAYNAQTEANRGTIIPVEITIFEDRSFTFITKTPPATTLIKKAAGIESGSPTPHTKKVGKITKKQVEEIAKVKMPDLNAGSMESAMRLIAGSARSMGIEVVEK